VTLFSDAFRNTLKLPTMYSPSNDVILLSLRGA